MLISGKRYLLTTDEFFLYTDGNMYRGVWGTCYVHNFQETFAFPAKGHANFFVTVGAKEMKEGVLLLAGCRINYCVECNEKPTIRMNNSVMTVENNQVYPRYHDNILIINDI
jgi:hypothetical protein